MLGVILIFDRITQRPPEVGKTAVEDVERSDLPGSIVVLRWKEADGTNVIDVLDLANMKLYANFVTADGQRFSSEPDVTCV